MRRSQVKLNLYGERGTGEQMLWFRGDGAAHPESGLGRFFHD